MIAAELGLSPARLDAGGYPSSTGVSAMDDAVITARASQSSRVSTQRRASVRGRAPATPRPTNNTPEGLAELM